MSLLSDEEIDEIQNREFSQNDWLWFYTRAIESAILDKLRAQKPVCYHYTFDCCGVPEDMFGHPDGYYPNDAVPLYTHPIPADDVVRDAARYRWLINNDSQIGICNLGDEFTPAWYLHDATEQVDAAMKGETK